VVKVQIAECEIGMQKKRGCRSLQSAFAQKLRRDWRS
jgi:hypothetical protein